MIDTLNGIFSAWFSVVPYGFLSIVVVFNFVFQFFYTIFAKWDML